MLSPATSLETRDLRLVQAIAAAGGVTRAARALHLSQSAVSHQLKDLESRLGLALFERGVRGVRLTEVGRRVLALAHEVLESMGRLEAELRAGVSAKVRPLRVSTQCQTAFYWLPQILGELERRHPDVALRIVPDVTGDPATSLAEGHIDVALVASRPLPRGFVSHALFEDELVALLYPGHPLARRPFILGSDLLEERLIFPEVPRKVRDQVLRALLPEGGAFPRVLRVPMTEVIVELVRARHGISVLPAWTVSAPIGRGELTAVRLTRRGLMRPWSVVHPRRSELAAPIRTLADLLRETCSPRQLRARS